METRDGETEDLTAVAEEKRDAARFGALLVHEMHIERTEAIYGNVCSEVRQLVEFGLLRAPVEAVLPLGNQPLYVG